MQSYLYIHKENTVGPQDRYRETYSLRHVNYEMSRVVGRRGEVVSDIRGGKIQLVIDGFANSLLLAWLFDPIRKEDGAIITIDEYEKGVEKLYFKGASAASFRMNYDSRMKGGVQTMITIDAQEIATDKDLHFQKR